MSNIFDIFKQIESQKTAASGPIEWLVVGLGNPGIRYQWTRHNAGFLAMDAITAKYGGNPERAKFNALVGETTIAGKRVLLMKPQTFMNSSGEAVRPAADFYKVPAENIIVLVDDINLDVGQMRIRRKGSSGGHNGMKSITEHLKTDDYPRIKLGVGKKPHPDFDLADFVLGNFSPADMKKLPDVFENASSALALIMKGDFDGAMCKYNS